MNVYARFDEIPSMTLKDVKKTKHYGRTDRQLENSIPAHKHSLRGGIITENECSSQNNTGRSFLKS